MPSKIPIEVLGGHPLELPHEFLHHAVVRVQVLNMELPSYHLSAAPDLNEIEQVACGEFAVDGIVIGTRDGTLLNLPVKDCSQCLDN